MILLHWQKKFTNEKLMIYFTYVIEVDRASSHISTKLTSSLCVFNVHCIQINQSEAIKQKHGDILLYIQFIAFTNRFMCIEKKFFLFVALKIDRAQHTSDTSQNVLHILFHQGFLICLWPRFFWLFIYPRDATRKREKGSEK